MQITAILCSAGCISCSILPHKVLDLNIPPYKPFIGPCRRTGQVDYVRLGVMVRN